MISRILLSIGYLASPFAGPGAAVITATGWFSYGSETKQANWMALGLTGLLGVAGILAAYHSNGLAGLASIGGILLLAYQALAIAALWIIGAKHNSLLLKASAIFFALSWLLAVAGAPASVSEATSVATGGLVDWAGAVWATQAAKGFIEAVGGAAAIARLLAAFAAVLAGVGFLVLPARGHRGISEERLLGIGAYNY
ncbi:MAG: hypothetical protein ABWW69_05100 [Pyrodictiaceae archaeon]